MAPIKSSVCALFLLAGDTVALQQSTLKDLSKENWSPLDIFRSGSHPDAESDDTAPVEELKQDKSDAKDAMKSASKHEHKSKGKVRHWELEDEVFENPPSEFCEASCTASNAYVATWDSKCSTTSCQGCNPCKELKRNNASKYVWRPPAQGDRAPPRMLVSLGCDGSSAILKHAHALLERHGIKVPGRGEVLGQRPYDVVLKGDGAMNRSMAEVHDDFASKNQTLLFRGTIATDRDTIFSQDLLDMGTLAVQVSRRNLVDQMVCMVKDCFAANMGQPVLRGVESEMCIKRRQPKNAWMREEYKAFINVSTMFRNLQVIEATLNKTNADLQTRGYKLAHVTAEDLLDFEWSEDMIWTAVPAWKRLLVSWGIKPLKTAIVEYLRENVGTRERPLSHKDVIFNYGMVAEEMENHTRYNWMMRE